MKSKYFACVKGHDFKRQIQEIDFLVETVILQDRECMPFSDFYLVEDTKYEYSTGERIFTGDVVFGCAFNGSYAEGLVVNFNSNYQIIPLVNIEGVGELDFCREYLDRRGNIFEDKFSETENFVKYFDPRKLF